MHNKIRSLYLIYTVVNIKALSGALEQVIHQSLAIACIIKNNARFFPYEKACKNTWSVLSKIAYSLWSLWQHHRKYAEYLYQAMLLHYSGFELMIS